MTNAQTEQTFSVTISVETADALIAIAGFTTDSGGRYIVPEDYREFIGHDFCWQRDEATMWAQRIIAEQEQWAGA